MFNNNKRVGGKNQQLNKFHQNVFRLFRKNELIGGVGEESKKTKEKFFEKRN